jgi:CheY-like chemotaxis protein
MVYATIKKHDGHIAVDSEEKKGTTFHIYLPAAEEVEAVTEDQEDFHLTGKGKILVMDDEEIIRNVIKKMLEMMGYQVECASGGVEAIEMYEKAGQSLYPFDAVIMDLTIPGGLGGKEAIQRLLKIDPQAKVVVSSGYSNDPIMANFEKYGFKGVVTKPYRMDDLGRTLHNVLTVATEHTQGRRS